MPLSMCHFHTEETPSGVRQPDGSYAYTCDLSAGHPSGREWSWLEVPAPAGMDGLGGIADEYGLQIELPAAVASYGGQWVEYGLVERAYALARPKDFAELVGRYGHREVKRTPYTVSAFLAGCLGRLAKQGHVAYHDGPATGLWAHNERISWWAPASSTAEWSDVRTWDAEGVDVSHVPGAR
jgi:hypothetical protein